MKEVREINEDSGWINEVAEGVNRESAGVNVYAQVISVLIM